MDKPSAFEGNTLLLKEHLTANNGQIVDVDTFIPVLSKIVEQFHLGHTRLKLEPSLLKNALLQKDLWEKAIESKKYSVFPTGFLGIEEYAKEVGEYIVQDLKEDKPAHIIAKAGEFMTILLKIKNIEEKKTQLKIAIKVGFEPEVFQSKHKYFKNVGFQKFHNYFNLTGMDFSSTIGPIDYEAKGAVYMASVEKLKTAAQKYIDTDLQELLTQVYLSQQEHSFLSSVSQQRIKAKDVYDNALKYIFTPSNYDLIIKKYPPLILFYDMNNLSLEQLKSFKNSLKEYLLQKSKFSRATVNKDKIGKEFNQISALITFCREQNLSPLKVLSSLDKYINKAGFEADAKEIEAMLLLGLNDSLGMENNHIFSYINDLPLTFTQKLKYMNHSVAKFIEGQKSENGEAKKDGLSELETKAAYEKGLILFIKNLKFTPHYKSSDELGTLDEFKELCLQTPEILNSYNTKDYPESIQKFIWMMGEDTQFATQFLKLQPSMAKSFSDKNLNAITDKEVIKAVATLEPNLLLNLKTPQWFEKELIFSIFTHNSVHKNFEGNKLYRHIFKHNKETATLNFIEFCIDSVLKNDNEKKEALLRAAGIEEKYFNDFALGGTAANSVNVNVNANGESNAQAQVANLILVKADLTKVSLETQMRAENLMGFVTSQTLDGLIIKEIKKNEARILVIYEKILILNSKKRKSSVSIASYTDCFEAQVMHLPLCVTQRVDWVMEMIDKYPKSSLFVYCRHVLVHSRKFSLHLVQEVCKKVKSENYRLIRSYLPTELMNFFEAANIKDNCAQFLKTYFEKKNLLDAISEEGEKEVLMLYHHDTFTLNILNKDYKEGKGLALLELDNGDSVDSEENTGLESHALEIEEKVEVKPIKKNKI